MEKTPVHTEHPFIRHFVREQSWKKHLYTKTNPFIRHFVKEQSWKNHLSTQNTLSSGTLSGNSRGKNTCPHRTPFHQALCQGTVVEKTPVHTEHPFIRHFVREQSWKNHLSTQNTLSSGTLSGNSRGKTTCPHRTPFHQALCLQTFPYYCFSCSCSSSLKYSTY